MLKNKPRHCLWFMNNAIYISSKTEDKKDKKKALTREEEKKLIKLKVPMHTHHQHHDDDEQTNKLLASCHDNCRRSSHVPFRQTPTVTAVHVDFLQFSASVTSPVSGNTYFLAGAGVRGLEIDSKFIKFTGIGVYLEDKAVASLATKWKGKTSKKLIKTLHFFRAIISGPFEKLIRGSNILLLSGPEYSSKVIENCVAHMKSAGIYGDAEAAAIEKFREAFYNVTFPPGASVFYRQSPDGILGISLSEEGTKPPRKEAAVIENKAVSEAVFSPDLKRNLASRLPKIYY